MVRQMAGILLAAGLGGCGPATSQLAATILPGHAVCGAGSSLFAAAPLCASYNTAPDGSAQTAAQADSATPPTSAQFIGAALADSIAKCDAFITRFTGGQATENLAFDVAGIALAGLGAMDFPAATAHALAAASAFTQGTKSALNSDLYQQLTVQIFVQQINSAYYAPIETLQQNLTGTEKASLLLPQIMARHRQCSIPFAAASLAGQAGH